VHSISFNGRFLDAPQTGVQRVARELILSVLQHLDANPELRSELNLRLIAPKVTRYDKPRDDLKLVRFGRFSGQAWEQLDLPRAPTGDLLVNLCNLSPLASTNSITMIHDAQVFQTPDSYSRAFRAWYKFALPRIGKSARRILTVSNFSADQLAANSIAPRDKIDVVHNGVDHILNMVPDNSVIERFRLEPGNYDVGVANVQTHKNVSVLLRTYQDQRLKNRTLVLFGSADLEAFEAAGLHLPPNVLLAGRLSDSELRALLESANSLLFPSRTEGFGLPPLEAMILGVPAICSNTGALPEVCGNAAIYAAPDNPTGWVNAILDIASERPSERQYRAENCKKQAEKYTWSKAGEKLIGVICRELRPPSG